MPYVHAMTPRLYDTDAAGVVFYAATYRFAQAALEEMLAEVYAQPLDVALRSGALCTPVVHSRADHRQPLHLGERCTVAVCVRSLSAHTITYQYTICRADGTLCANLQTVHAFIEARTGRPIYPAPAFLAGLRRLGLLP